jgi:hypothetical protein
VHRGVAEVDRADPPSHHVEDVDRRERGAGAGGERDRFRRRPVVTRGDEERGADRRGEQADRGTSQ